MARRRRPDPVPDSPVESDAPVSESPLEASIRRRLDIKEKQNWRRQTRRDLWKEVHNRAPR